jgi:hypothetical protein
MYSHCAFKAPPQFVVDRTTGFQMHLSVQESRHRPKRFSSSALLDHLGLVPDHIEAGRLSCKTTAPCDCKMKRKSGTLRICGAPLFPQSIMDVFFGRIPSCHNVCGYYLVCFFCFCCLFYFSYPPSCIDEIYISKFELH